MTTPVITQEDIEAIYAIPDYIQPAAFIAQATLMVSEFPFPGYSQDRINYIGLYLCIHLMHCYEPETSSYEGMKIVDKSFGSFLQSSFYGQTACIFDIDGFMIGWGKPKARLMYA